MTGAFDLWMPAVSSGPAAREEVLQVTLLMAAKRM